MAETLTEVQVGRYLRQNPDFLASWFVNHADDNTLKSLARKLKADAVSLQNSQSPLPPIQQGDGSSSRLNTAGSDRSRRLSAPGEDTGNTNANLGAANSATASSCNSLIESSENKTTHSSSSSINSTEERNTISKYTTFSKVGRNSITSMIFRKYLDGDRTRRASVKKDLEDLRRMSEEELFMELIRDISSELDVTVLCHKILQNVSILTNSDRGSLFLVRGSRDSKFLVSKLFDVTESSTLEQSVHTAANEIVVPFGVGIAGNVAKSGEAININDVYADPRFNQEVDKKTGYRTHSILSMPILNYEGEVVGVAQIINKISGNHEFTKQDEDLFKKYLTFCGIGITNAQLFEMSVNEFKRNQLLLHLARGIFEEQSNLEKLVQKIMLDAQDLLKCEKCCVFLLEDSFERDPSNARATDSKSVLGENSVQEKRPPPKNPEEVIFSKAFELCEGQIKVPSGKEIAESKIAHIARSTVVAGEPLNVEDLSKDTRFGKVGATEENGFTSKSMLCMPIHNSDRTIIGVTQLINKANGQPFDDNDQHIIEAFSIFTGLGIHNCQMYENACQLMAKQSVALEVLSYHATASKEEAERLMGGKGCLTDEKDQETCFKKTVEKIPTADDYRLYTYDFDDLTMNDDDTIKATIRMFMDADLINQFKVPYETMCRWVCTVKKNYRPVTYHNWRHAFNVCQTMFTMLYTGELRPKFDAVEVFALMAACLCHDLDHRGTNNAFQVKVASPLAMLYSTSVLEHHHFDHCIMILNSEGNNIFQSFSPEEYRRAIKILEHAILSTDLALYFKKRGDFKALVQEGERNFREEYKKDLLKAMMMTACDVAAITKPWRIQKEIAQLVTAEFFEQGDIEKTQLGEKPIPMMDREKKDELPKMQVDFIDFICKPVYELFSQISTSLRPLNEGCLDNRRHWEELATVHKTNVADSSKDSNPEGEGSKENKTGNGPPKQTKGDNTAGKRDSSVQAAQEPVMRDQGSKHDSVPTNFNVNTSNHIISKPQCAPEPQENCNITRREHDLSSPSTPAIEKADAPSKVVSKRELKSGTSKKSSKSSKSNFCSVS